MNYKLFIVLFLVNISNIVAFVIKTLNIKNNFDVNVNMLNVIPKCPEDYTEWPKNYLRKECCEMAKVVSKLDIWDLLKDESLNICRPIFWSNEKIELLKELCWSHGHNITTMSTTLLVMQFIAVNGFEAYVNQVNEYNNKNTIL